MDSLSRVAAGFGLVAAVAWAMVAYSAAEADKLPPPIPLQQIAPHPADHLGDRGLSGGSGEPLSRKLDRSSGVIRPPADIDPGLAQLPPPAGRRSTPVIPPPGAGGDGDVNPK